MVITTFVEPRALQQLRAAHDRQDEELRRLITEAARAGIRSQDIAEVLGVSRSTLWRRYGGELRRPDTRVIDDDAGLPRPRAASSTYSRREGDNLP